MGNLSAFEIGVILVIGLLLFGSKLPQVGRSLGKTLSEFKRGLRGMEEDFEKLQRDADRELEEEERNKHKAPPPDQAPILPPDHPPALLPPPQPPQAPAPESTGDEHKTPTG